ncbi:exopolyphosphatase PRUNE1-like [Oryza brachyantha]|uniref:exopolyphosphatase PRUNE1-like n=1 Tax=Oryza brachyantha TaxID=4533 RepID=UPI001ADA2759|nr:exopolyphosphatase PRUNE1-like [Oryza brachyantha]
MSRSARRHRQPGGIGDEILQRASISSSSTSSPPRADPFASAPSSPAHSLPPNPPSSRRKSRFHDPSAPDSSSTSTYRRTASSTSTSPTSASNPRLPHHRRHASASSAPAVDGLDLNSFLRRQRAAVAELGSASRPPTRSTKIVLSDASKSVSSIAAAICYAWMLASKADAQAAVPVVNMRRGRMERCRQAAWLLYHVGVDASALLFADEVDMDRLMMDKRVSLVVVGQDVLKPNDKMGSVCTILTNNYCEDAYSLLQSLDIKKLLLAGILLDTKNLSSMCSNKDSEAVELLLFGTSEHTRHELFQKLLLDHNDHSFVEYLKNTYRESSTRGEGDSPPDQKYSVSASRSSQDAKKPNSNNQRPAHGNGGKASDEAPRGKNKFFLAKWFGFGSK